LWMPTFKFARNKECKKDTARYDFMESLANALITTDWENFANWAWNQQRLNLSGVTKKDQPKDNVGKNQTRQTSGGTWVNNWSGLCPIFGRRIYE
jgi:hypothetical protein